MTKTQMTREDYTLARHTYRELRREDAKWRPDPYAARNKVQTPPRNAARYAALFDPDIAQTFFSPPVMPRGNYRLPRGPRAYAMASKQDVYGLTLNKRAAIRKAQREIAERFGTIN